MVDTNPKTAPLLDVRGLARWLNVSCRQIWRLRDSGALPPAVRLGACVRWDPATIESWVAQGCPRCRNGGSEQRGRTREAAAC